MQNNSGLVRQVASQFERFLDRKNRQLHNSASAFDISQSEAKWRKVVLDGKIKNIKSPLILGPHAVHRKNNGNNGRLCCSLY